jgi:iron complex transport system ATP-binding protein
MSTPPSVPVARLHVERFFRDDVEILHDVRWSLERGQHWVVLGANGSGKTSLVRILAGYEWPSAGTVEVLGETFGRTEIGALRRRMGFVSASFGDLFPEAGDAMSVVLSGFDASIGLWRDPTAAEIARARAALAAIGAEAIETRRTGVLSQGERQRVLIARALVHRPVLLILDEPCAGLDPLARDRLLDDLARLAARRDGPTLVQVTHHVEEISPFITDALLLAGGRTVAAGAVDQVLTSENLALTYGAPAELHREQGRFRLRFP